MLGLDNAGKTSNTKRLLHFLTLPFVAILYKLKFDKQVTTVPTVGFNVESLMMKNVKFNVWVILLSCLFFAIFPCRMLGASTNLDLFGVTITQELRPWCLWWMQMTWRGSRRHNRNFTRL